MIKTIMFDFDGTIINTNALIQDGLRYLANRYSGKTLDHHAFRQISGKPLEQQLAHIHPEKVDLMMEQFQIWYKHNHNIYAKAFPGMTVLIDSLSKRGMGLGIVTNNSTPVLNMGLDHLHMSHYFEVKVSRDDVASAKPHPEGILKALAMLGARPEETMFVGDTESDMLAAKAAGLTTCFVTWSLIDYTLFEVEPDILISSPTTLLQFLDERRDSVA
jgi:pyrophosphatase PpaX